MSRSVLVVGASGYIGNGVARAFRRRGYRVFGSTRTLTSTLEKEFLRNEIDPVVGDTSNPSSLHSQILQSNVIVDAVGYSPGSPAAQNFFDYVVSVKRKEQEATKDIPNFKTLYIFTSGIMIYATGERVDFPIDESLEPKPRDPIEMVPKKAVELHILKHHSPSSPVHPVVVRPGFVYGGTGGVIAPLFFSLPNTTDGSIPAWGSLDKRWSWVHVDDLAEGYVAIANAPSAAVSGEVFNLAAPNDNPTFLELKYHGARAAGWKGSITDIRSVPVPKDQDRASNWEWNVIINPRKAIERLGWQPHHLGALQEIDTSFKAWKASKL